MGLAGPLSVRGLRSRPRRGASWRRQDEPTA